MKTTLIIACGGVGARTGFSIPKQFMNLKGKPVLYWTLKNTSAFSFDEIIVTYPRGYKERTEEIVMGVCSNAKIVMGGDRRQDTVKNAVLCSGKYDVLFIHDGVRPFVSMDLLNRMNNKIKDAEGVIPGIKLIDTVKKAERGVVLETVDRDKMFSIQTPQVFKRNVYLEILESIDWTKDYTDDASMFEVMSKKIAIVEGLRYNIKITYPEDIIWAEKILEDIYEL